MATGELPFQGATPFELSMEIMVAAPRKLAEVPEPLQSILQRCLVKDPAERCGQAREVMTALENKTENPPTLLQPLIPADSATMVLPVASPVPVSRRRWWFIAGVAAALLALTFALILARTGVVEHNAPARRPESNAAAAFGVGKPEVKVWVNKRSGTYHCPGTTWYGKTLEGEYMTQQNAQAKGYHPAAQRACL
jgi:hypothetical protein